MPLTGGRAHARRSRDRHCRPSTPRPPRDPYIELYFGAIDVVRHVPSKLAQHFLTLDHVAQGRAFFAVARVRSQERAHVRTPARIGSAKKLEDSLAIIRKIFDAEGAPIWYEGERYSMKGGTVEVPPYGDRPPPVLAATGGTPEVLELVGRYSDGLLTNLPGMCHGGPEQFARDRQTIRDAAGAAWPRSRPAEVRVVGARAHG